MVAPVPGPGQGHYYSPFFPVNGFYHVLFFRAIFHILIDKFYYGLKCYKYIKCVTNSFNKEDFMTKTVCRLLVLSLCIAVPATSLYPQQAAPKKDKPADKKQAAEEQKKNGEEGNDTDAAKKTGGGEVTLKEIVVKGEQFLKKSPYTINVVNSNDIEKQGISRTADIIKSVPGVKMHEYDQGGVSNAIAIRGFQSGVHGGDMGVYLDGIPLNEYYGHGGGYADPNILIPIELDKVLVYKGPSSALYGNFSRGGTIVYMTKKGGDYVDVNAKYGSWNTVDIQSALGKTIISDKLTNNTAVQFYRTDGFQENSKQLFGNGSTRFTYRPTGDLEITLSLRAHGDDWNSPGYYSRTQWGMKKYAYKQQMFNPLSLPLDINDVAQNDGGERRQFTERLDVNYSAGQYVKILAWGFGLQTNWTRFSKFGSGSQAEQGYRVGKYGTGISANLDVPIHGDIRLKGVLGYEFFRDGTVYRRFQTFNRTRENLTQKKYTTFDTHAFFLETEWGLHQYFCPVIAVRADLFTGTFKNAMYLQDALGTADPLQQILILDERHQTINPRDYTSVSPKFGFISELVRDVLRFRANASNGFVMPPDTTIFQTWQHLKPSKIWQYEAGLTATYEKYLWVDVTGYMIDVANEANEYPAGSNIYRNMGTTRRWGIESTVKVMPVKYLELDGTFTWMDSKVRDIPWIGTDPATYYINVGNLLTKGKPLPNLPEYEAGAEIIWSSPIGLGGGFGWTYVGPQYTDSYGTRTWSQALTLRYLSNINSWGLDPDPIYKGYNLFDLYLSYTMMANNTPVTFRFDAKNILNEHYAGYAGGSSVWAPGAPRSFYGSVNMKF